MDSFLKLFFLSIRESINFATKVTRLILQTANLVSISLQKKKKKKKKKNNNALRAIEIIL
jgi:hypothetical protein